MPLVKCDECLGQVSDQAFECPHCGVPLRSRPRVKKGVTWLGLAAFVIAFAVGYYVVRAANSDEAAPPSAGLAGALRPSQELLDTSYEIDEGGYFFQSFELLTDARVQLEVYARPESVDVMLMTPSDFENYREVQQDLSGGKFTYRSSLSSKEVVRFDQTEILPKGEYVIVIARPIENVLFPQSTTTDITVTVY